MRFSEYMREKIRFILVKSTAEEYNAGLRYVKYTTVASNLAVLKSTKDKVIDAEVKQQ